MRAVRLVVGVLVVVVILSAITVSLLSGGLDEGAVRVAGFLPTDFFQFK
jgi:hypothetical protein